MFDNFTPLFITVDPWWGLAYLSNDSLVGFGYGTVPYFPLPRYEKITQEPEKNFAGNIYFVMEAFDYSGCSAAACAALKVLTSQRDTSPRPTSPRLSSLNPEANFSQIPTFHQDWNLKTRIMRISRYLPLSQIPLLRMYICTRFQISPFLSQIELSVIMRISRLVKIKLNTYTHYKLSLGLDSIIFRFNH